MSRPNQKPLVHLLKPGEYRVWCMPPDHVPGKMTCTTMPSKTTCSACLTQLVKSTRGGHKTFKVSHIPARLDEEK